MRSSDTNRVEILINISDANKSSVVVGTYRSGGMVVGTMVVVLVVVVVLVSGHDGVGGDSGPSIHPSMYSSASFMY